MMEYEITECRWVDFHFFFPDSHSYGLASFFWHPIYFFEVNKVKGEFACLEAILKSKMAAFRYSN